MTGGRRPEDGPLSGEIEWRKVSVQYPGASASAVQEVSLRIPAGQSLALIGPVGSGKSTLASLLPRLHDPSQGQVLVGGVDIRRFPVSALRRYIGYVPQESFLFSRTIARNIRLGVPEAPDQDVHIAATTAMLEGGDDGFRTDWKPWLASAASRYPAVRSNAWRSPARY